MKKYHAPLAAAVTALALAAAPAQADTIWNFSYSGSGVAASGSFETLGDGSTPSLVEWISGTYSDGTTVNGALSLVPTTQPGVNDSADGFYTYDNLYGGPTRISADGLLFLAGTQEIDLYLDDVLSITNVTTYDNGVTFNFTAVNFTAVPAVVPVVPEPGAFAMLLAGLGVLGAVRRQRKSA